MAATAPDKIDPLLRVALARLRHDHRATAFVNHPCAIELVETDEDGFLAALQARMEAGRYVPQPSREASTPKPGWHVRPATILTLEDELVYHYLTLRCVASVRETNEWSEGKFRFSYLVRPEPEGKEWFARRFAGWKSFSDVSLSLLRQGYPFVVMADIAAYYENIDIGMLTRDLATARVDQKVVGLLSACLNKWAMPRGKGIPQSLSPSHVFGEFYLDSIDRELKRKEADFLRYLDDFRIFCKTERDARLALHLLTSLLRERGLNIQAAKSEVVSNEEARQKIEHVPHLVTEVTQRVTAQLEAFAKVDKYITPEDLRKYILENPEELEKASIQEIWEDFAGGKIPFDKTVFHFLMSRLRDAKLPTAVRQSIAIMRERPEETGNVLDYVQAFIGELDANDLGSIAEIATSAETIFEYQRYLIIRWFTRCDVKQSDILAFCRAHATASSPFHLLRPYVLAYLGQHAERPHDYELLTRAYAELQLEMDRATIVCALRNAPAALRNNFYARCKGESPWIDRALVFAKKAAR